MRYDEHGKPDPWWYREIRIRIIGVLHIVDGLTLIILGTLPHRWKTGWKTWIGSVALRSMMVELSWLHKRYMQSNPEVRRGSAT